MDALTPLESPNLMYRWNCAECSDMCCAHLHDAAMSMKQQKLIDDALAIRFPMRCFSIICFQWKRLGSIPHWICKDWQTVMCARSSLDGFDFACEITQRNDFLHVKQGVL